MAEIDTSMYQLPEHRSPFSRANDAATLMNTLESNKLLQTQVSLEGLKLSMEQTSNLRRSMAGLAAKKGELTPKDFYDIMGREVSEGRATPEQIAVEMQNLPTNEGELRDYAKQQAFMLMSAEQQMGMLFDKISAETGAGTYITSRNVLTGDVDPNGTFIGRGIDPSTLAQTQSIVGDDMRSRPVTLQEILEQRGQGGLAIPQVVTGVGPGQIPGGNELTNVGGAPPAEAIPGTAAPQPVEPAVITDPGSVGPASSLAPGEAEAATAAAGVYAKESEMAANYADRVFPAEQALVTIKKMTPEQKTESFGPSSETWNEITSALNTLGIAGEIEDALGFTLADVDTVKKYDEVRKYLTQYAQRQASGLGPHTDSGLATTLMGQPNVHISGMAIEDLLKSTLAIERYKQARWLAFQEAHLPANQWTRFAAKFGGDHDIRAFALDLSNMDDGQMAKWYDGLSKRDQERVNRSAQLGSQYGLMRD